FRSFRLSSFSSPTFSDRALRLSNSENVVGFRYRGGSIEKPKRIAEMTPSRNEAIELSSRCLQIPSTSVDASLDRTLPMTMGNFCDSHTDNLADDSGLFCSDIGLHSTSTPLRSPPQEFPNCAVNIAPIHNPYADLCMKAETSESSIPASSLTIMKSSPSTPSSFKRAMRDVQRQGILQPRKLLVDNTNVVSSRKDLSSKQKIEDNELGKRRRESTITVPFEPPKKPLKPSLASTK
ncbi:hypothetical protein NECAME_11476, partial [Necator americanus]